MATQSQHARSRACGFYDVYTKIDDLHYPSSMTSKPAIALNDRANHNRGTPSTPSFHRALIDPVLLTPLRNAARDLGYDLV